eukprot:8587172-Lingulodinium_polyedra.AAC.1
MARAVTSAPASRYCQRSRSSPGPVGPVGSRGTAGRDLTKADKLRCNPEAEQRAAQLSAPVMRCSA